MLPTTSECRHPESKTRSNGLSGTYAKRSPHTNATATPSSAARCSAIAIASGNRSRPVTSIPCSASQTENTPGATPHIKGQAVPIPRLHGRVENRGWRLPVPGQPLGSPPGVPVEPPHDLLGHRGHVKPLPVGWARRVIAPFCDVDALGFGQLVHDVLETLHVRHGVSPLGCWNAPGKERSSNPITIGHGERPLF